MNKSIVINHKKMLILGIVVIGIIALMVCMWVMGNDNIECSDGDLRCYPYSQTIMEKCADGKWVEEKECPLGCSDNGEVECIVCQEEYQRCSPEQEMMIQICDNNKWIDWQPSPLCVKTECETIDFKEIVFIYSLECPHCQKMAPIVKELEEEGYEFFWAESGSVDGKKAYDCYSEIPSGYIPQFICNNNNETIDGYMEKEELKEWIDEKCGGEK